MFVCDRIPARGIRVQFPLSPRPIGTLLDSDPRGTIGSGRRSLTTCDDATSSNGFWGRVREDSLCSGVRGTPGFVGRVRQLAVHLVGFGAVGQGRRTGLS